MLAFVLSATGCRVKTFSSAAIVDNAYVNCAFRTVSHIALTTSALVQDVHRDKLVALKSSRAPVMYLHSADGTHSLDLARFS